MGCVSGPVAQWHGTLDHLTMTYLVSYLSPATFARTASHVRHRSLAFEPRIIYTMTPTSKILWMDMSQEESRGPTWIVAYPRVWGVFDANLQLQAPRTTAWRSFDTFSHITLVKLNWAFIPVWEMFLGPLLPSRRSVPRFWSSVSHVQIEFTKLS